MKLADLKEKSIVIVGLGQEGLATLDVLEGLFPDKPIGLADRSDLERLNPEAQQVIRARAPSRAFLGPDYLSCLANHEVIVKSPGIPPSLPSFQRAIREGKKVTSHTEIFFSNCPGVIIGVTGTKGKSTTSSLIHAVLGEGGLDSFLVGNIGNPPLSLLQGTRHDSVFVYELSSHQLDGLSQSPHIAVVLNVVPEHLDYYESFERYVLAKHNITRFQSTKDYVVYNAAFPIPTRFADESSARKIPFSAEGKCDPGCFVENGGVVCRLPGGAPTRLLEVEQVTLLGGFNIQNVLPACAVGRLLGVAPAAINRAVLAFRSLPHRLELVGTFFGITFYDDALATIPEATIGALDALGHRVETILLGGFERHLDFTGLARRLLASEVKNLILFPTTGKRIGEALQALAVRAEDLPRCFFVAGMDEAVSLAFRHTRPGMICLHSPASPSFGIFANYRERGALFQRCVRKEGGGSGGDLAGGPGEGPAVGDAGVAV